MRKVRHKNVVQFIGACTRKPNLCIVFEFMSGGSVYDYIRRVSADSAAGTNLDTWGPFFDISGCACMSRVGSNEARAGQMFRQWHPRCEFPTPACVNGNQGCWR